MSKRLSFIRWYGGKGRLIAKILPYLPETKIYCEPFGGGVSILLNKPPAMVEIYNDIDGYLVNLFRVMQDKTLFDAFMFRVSATLYCKEEFITALNTIQRKNAGEDIDAVDLAWAFYVGCIQGFSGVNPDKLTPGTWSRVFVSRRKMARNVSGWINHIDTLDLIYTRLSRVQIDNTDGIKCIQYWDTPDTLFYLDPPYIIDTRKTKKQYYKEMDNDVHCGLISALLSIKGYAVISGYNHPMYRSFDAVGWKKIEWETAVHAAGRTRTSGLQGTGACLAKVPRTECLWISPRTVDLLRVQGREL